MATTLTVSSFVNLSEETCNVWSEHPVLSGWAHGMCWKWEGGESLTVLVGRDNPKVWHIIKHKGEVQVVQYMGIKPALLAEFGIKAVV